MDMIRNTKTLISHLPKLRKLVFVKLYFWQRFYKSFNSGSGRQILFFSGRIVINRTSGKPADQFITNCVHNDARDSARLFDVAMAFKQFLEQVMLFVCFLERIVSFYFLTDKNIIINK